MMTAKEISEKYGIKLRTVYGRISALELQGYFFSDKIKRYDYTEVIKIVGFWDYRETVEVIRHEITYHIYESKLNYL